MTHEQLAAMEWALEVLGCIYSPVNERDIEEVGTRMATLRTIIEQAKRQQTLAAPVPDVSLIDEGRTAAPVQEGRDWSLLEATQESLREHMAEIGRLKAIIDAAGQQEPVAWAVHYKGPIPLFTKTKSEAEAWGDHVRGLLNVQAKLREKNAQPSKPLTDELNQIAEDLRFHGLTLVKTVTGYAVLKLGHITAHAKGDA